MRPYITFILIVFSSFALLSQNPIAEHLSYSSKARKDNFQKKTSVIENNKSQVKVSYLKGGYGIDDNKDENSFNVDNEKIIRKSINSKGQVVITYLTENNNNNSQIVAREIQTKNNNVNVFNPNKPSVQSESQEIAQNENVTGSSVDYLINSASQESKKVSQEDLAKYEVYNKDYSIYREVYDPKTGKLTQVYDFSSEQYNWGREKKN